MKYTTEYVEKVERAPFGKVNLLVVRGEITSEDIKKHFQKQGPYTYTPVDFSGEDIPDENKGVVTYLVSSKKESQKIVDGLEDSVAQAKE